MHHVRAQRPAATRAAGIAIALTTGLCSLHSPARAADAAAQFEYGLSEMLAGRYATGCPAIDASFRLDPRPGTLFTLADCYRQWGRTASALARFAEYVALYERMAPEQKANKREHERATIAADERQALEKSVPLLTLRLPSEAPPGTRVWRDDVEVPESMFGTAVPVDPGGHRIRARLPDGREREQSVSLATGQQQTVIVELAPAPEVMQPAVSADIAPAGSPSASPPPSPAPSPPPAGPATDRPSHVGWVYATAGLSVVSAGVASVTWLMALSRKSSATPVCDARGICTTQQGADAGNQAHALANVETGAWIVGGVALAAALVLWLTEPHPEKSSKTSVVWHPGGLAARW